MKKCNCEDLLQEAAEYQGRKVTLNNPTRSSDCLLYTSDAADD